MARSQPAATDTPFACDLTWAIIDGEIDPLYIRQRAEHEWAVYRVRNGYAVHYYNHRSDTHGHDPDVFNTFDRAVDAAERRASDW